ncbi:hypothetical protein L0F63_004136 [Massospora cicadina]|nr:hypothetical protein L0F63_004136 [Massospora cicadina]
MTLITRRALPEPSSIPHNPRPPVTPPQPINPTTNDLSWLLVDLMKKLASFPSVVPVFIPHYTQLLNIATSVPFLSRDMLHIIELVHQQDSQPSCGATDTDIPAL